MGRSEKVALPSRLYLECAAFKLPVSSTVNITINFMIEISDHTSEAGGVGGFSCDKESKLTTLWPKKARFLSSRESNGCEFHFFESDQCFNTSDRVTGGHPINLKQAFKHSEERLGH